MNNSGLAYKLLKIWYFKLNMMRNIRVVFAVLSLSVVLVAGVADELQAQEKRQGWI